MGLYAALAAQFSSAADGQPDHTFGHAGHAIIAYGAPALGASAATALAFDRNGNVLLSGPVRMSGNYDAIGLVRLDRSGQEFPGQIGLRIVDVTSFPYGQGTLPVFTSKLVGSSPSNGTIVVGVDNSTTPNNNYEVATDAAGSIDTTFGGSGYGYQVQAGFPERPGAALRRDGGILLIGQRSPVGIYAAVLMPDGKGLERFGQYSNNTVGIIVWKLTNAVIEQAIDVPDDTDPTAPAIFACGSAEDASGTNTVSILAAFDEQGDPAPAFSTQLPIDDAAGSEPSSSCESVAIDAERRVIVSGYRRSSDASSGSYYVARLGTDGHSDPSFGTGGIVFGRIDGASASSASSVALQNDGKVVLGVNATDSAGNSQAYLLRLSPAGTVDADFGNAGLVTVKYRDGPEVSNRVSALGVQSERIVAAGSSIAAGADVADMAAAAFDVDVLYKDGFDSLP